MIDITITCEQCKKDDFKLVIEKDEIMCKCSNCGKMAIGFGMEPEMLREIIKDELKLHEEK